MKSRISVKLSDLLFAVSEAMDLANPSLPDHSVRTAYMALRIAAFANCTPALKERLFVAALLHDIGALSPEDRVAVNLMEDVAPRRHCERGQRLLSGTFWLAPAAPIVAWHHTEMRTHMAEGRAISDEDVFAAQILFVTERVERSVRRDRFVLHQFEEIFEGIRSMPDTLVHPDVLACFCGVACSEHFWLTLTSNALPAELRKISPVNTVLIEYDDLHSLCAVFKNMIDFRSPFTATHSRGVAACAHEIAMRMGFAGDDLRQIELAGYLHDIGKLVVPNAILEKPGPLSREETLCVRQHAHLTHRILSQVGGFEKIARWASLHHERLDGSGYVSRHRAGDLDLGARIIAVADIATAVAEHRPYRAGCMNSEVMAVLRELVTAGKIDPDVVRVYADDSAEISERVRSAQRTDMDLYADFTAQR